MSKNILTVRSTVAKPPRALRSRMKIVNTTIKCSLFAVLLKNTLVNKSLSLLRAPQYCKSWMNTTVRNEVLRATRVLSTADCDRNLKEPVPGVSSITRVNNSDTCSKVRMFLPQLIILPFRSSGMGMRDGVTVISGAWIRSDTLNSGK